MKHILGLAAGIVCLTAFVGISFSALELNHLVGCFGEKYHVPPLLMASAGGVALTYSIWSNRKSLSADGKETRLAIATFLFGPIIALFVQVVIPLASMSWFAGGKVEILLYAITLLFFTSIGNYVTTTRREGFGGIRNIWTLRSRVIWANTQRLHGHLLVFGGLATVLLIPLGSTGLAMSMLAVVYLVSICASTAYSAYLSFSMEPAL